MIVVMDLLKARNEEEGKGKKQTSLRSIASCLDLHLDCFFCDLSFLRSSFMFFIFFMLMLLQRADMIKAIRLAKSAGAELIILSDANTVFIEVILKAYGCEDVFSEVVTNPGWFEGNGRLSVKRWVPAEKPHGCGMCSLNMCKGFFFFLLLSHVLSFLLIPGDFCSFFIFFYLFFIVRRAGSCSVFGR